MTSAARVKTDECIFASGPIGKKIDTVCTVVYHTGLFYFAAVVLTATKKHLQQTKENSQHPVFSQQYHLHWVCVAMLRVSMRMKF